MRLSEVRQIIRMRPPELNATRRRLADCHDISDLRTAARRIIPRPVFDYVDGAADEELALAANSAAYRRYSFLPRALADVSATDTSARLLGRELPLPLVLAPAGYPRIMHPEGEAAAVRSAVRHGLPYTLSTMGTMTIEEVAAAGGAGLWFQLYVLKDRALNEDMLARAADSGYAVLVVTVDTVVAGNRVRDERNGFVVPPRLTERTLLSIGSHPGYWMRMLRSPAIDFANFAGYPAMSIKQTASMFNPAITWDDVAEVRSLWKGRLLVKGPLGAADARRAAEVGADGIQLSNHGGRQLDRTVPPADLIAEVREAVGPSMTLIADSGIRHGADIVVALALGADAAGIGRAYLYGLMAGGEAGVDRTLDLLGAQFKRTMQLLGLTSVAELRKRGRELLRETSTR